MKIEKVKEFHDKFKVPYKTTPEIPRHRASLRVRLLKEEIKELQSAILENDVVEVLDALVDIEYVLKGTILEFGMQNIFDKAFAEVHNSNLSKLDENGEPILREDGKVLKGDNYFKPNLKQFIK